MPDTSSQSPLAKKLAVKPNMRMIALGAPEWYRAQLGDLPAPLLAVRCGTSTRRSCTKPESGVGV